MRLRQFIGLVLPIALFVAASGAHAAVTTAGCLAQKQKAWGGFRKCEAGEKAKLLQAKPADVAKCQTKLRDQLDKLTAKATAAAIACRYGDNGDGTVTDYDTGLQWEQKTDDGSVHDKDNLYAWCVDGPDPDCACDNATNPPDGTALTAFLGTLNNGASVDGSVTGGCFAGHCDWRLPAIGELAGIVDTTLVCGGASGPCVDQAVFGPMVASVYGSASANAGLPNEAWVVDFGVRTGYVGSSCKGKDVTVTGVRSRL